MADLVAGDTNSAIRATLRRNDGIPFDLTGSTVVIKFRNNDATPIQHFMTIMDALNGVVQYTFQAGELVPGKMYVEFEVRD